MKDLNLLTFRLAWLGSSRNKKSAFVWFSLSMCTFIVHYAVQCSEFQSFFFTSFQYVVAMEKHKYTKAEKIVWFFPNYALLKLFTEKWLAILMKEFRILSGSLFRMRKKLWVFKRKKSRICRFFVHFQSVNRSIWILSFLGPKQNTPKPLFSDFPIEKLHSFVIVAVEY